MLTDKSVSSRHVRLTWRGGRIIVEDLGSANGTFVDGNRVDKAVVRPGDDVRLGREPLPWSDRRLRAFLRLGAGGDTIVGTPLGHRRFICGKCGARGLLPAGVTHGDVRCAECAAQLSVGRSVRGASGIVLAVVAAAAMVALAWWLVSEPGPLQLLREAAAMVQRDAAPASPPRSPQEKSIREHVVPRVLPALDAQNPRTRNEAVRLAARDEGPYSVEQIIRIWAHVRSSWHYVNDPRGAEYFARASETIDNDYAGDCDDFAIVLTAMTAAIGGQGRVIMMDGPGGGHAYAEVCVEAEPESVAQRLTRHWGQLYPSAAGGRSELPSQIHFRRDDQCPVWLNLDWNAGVPGGPYAAESWAIAIYADGRTETLASAQGPPREGLGVEGIGRAIPPPAR